MAVIWCETPSGRMALFGITNDENYVSYMNVTSLQYVVTDHAKKKRDRTSVDLLPCVHCQGGAVSKLINQSSEPLNSSTFHFQEKLLKLEFKSPEYTVEVYQELQL